MGVLMQQLKTTVFSPHYCKIESSKSLSCENTTLASTIVLPDKRESDLGTRPFRNLKKPSYTFDQYRIACSARLMLKPLSKKLVEVSVYVM